MTEDQLEYGMSDYSEALLNACEIKISDGIIMRDIV